VGFRASLPGRARSLRPGGRSADAFLVFSSPERSLSPSRLRVVARSLPSCAWTAQRPVRPALQGLEWRRDRFVPLGTTGSREVLSPCDRRGATRAGRGAGSCLRLTAPACAGSSRSELPRRGPTLTLVRARRRRPSMNGWLSHRVTTRPMPAAAALRRLAPRCDPRIHLAATRRPSPGVSCASRTRTRSRGAVMGSARPVRRFDTLRACSKSSHPPGSRRTRALLRFAPLQRPIAARPHHGHRALCAAGERCILPWALSPFDTCQDGGPVSARPPGLAACHVRGLATSLAATTTIPADALRRRSVPRLHPSRPSPRSGRSPSRDSLPSCPSSRGLASPS
jgi:hypothetical protein